MNEKDDSKSVKVDVRVQAGECKFPRGAGNYRPWVFSELSPQKEKGTVPLLPSTVGIEMTQLSTPYFGVCIRPWRDSL